MFIYNQERIDQFLFAALVKDKFYRIIKTDLLKYYCKWLSSFLQSLVSTKKIYERKADKIYFLIKIIMIF